LSVSRRGTVLSHTIPAARDSQAGGERSEGLGVRQMNSRESWALSGDCSDEEE
jgi:hypothetical protein